jgi:hypothetical protein
MPQGGLSVKVSMIDEVQIETVKEYLKNKGAFKLSS